MGPRHGTQGPLATVSGLLLGRAGEEASGVAQRGPDWGEWAVGWLAWWVQSGVVGAVGMGQREAWLR